MDGENNGKPYENGWFGGTTIFGNIHISFVLSWDFFSFFFALVLLCILGAVHFHAFSCCIPSWNFWFSRRNRRSLPQQLSTDPRQRNPKDTGSTRFFSRGLYKYITGWWKLKLFFIFTPVLLGRWSNLTNAYFFTYGWSNHQLYRFSMFLSSISPELPGLHPNFSVITGQWYHGQWQEVLPQHLARSAEQIPLIHPASLTNMVHHENRPKPKRKFVLSGIIFRGKLPNLRGEGYMFLDEVVSFFQWAKTVPRFFSDMNHR